MQIEPNKNMKLCLQGFEDSGNSENIYLDALFRGFYAAIRCNYNVLQAKQILVFVVYT